jgi:hypothetical protein
MLNLTKRRAAFYDDILEAERIAVFDLRMPIFRRPGSPPTFDRFSRYAHFPTDSEMFPLPITGLVLRELRIEGSGKDCTLCMVLPDGRRSEVGLGCSQFVIDVEGTVRTDILRIDDGNLCVRYTAPRLVVTQAFVCRESRGYEPEDWDTFMRELAVFQDGLPQGECTTIYDMPKGRMTVTGEPRV